MPDPNPDQIFDFSAVPARADLPFQSLHQADLPKELIHWADIWQKLPRHNSPIPQKSELSIPRLGRLAASIAIFERHDKDKYTIRLAGTEVEAWLNHSLTGIDPLLLVPQRQRPQVAAVYNTVTGQPCGFFIVEALMVGRDKQAQVSTLKLPLLGDNGAVRFFLSSYHFSEAEFVSSIQDEAPAEHREIHRFGYIDIGFGLPK